jgi:GntR family transcriptional regulator
MIGIDLQNRKPIYEQIVERFQTLIVNGILEPDSQMPSVRSLAMELSINPNTIQKAYAILEQQGYIYPVKGRGNFVSGNAGLKAKKQEGVYQELKALVEKGRELDIDCETFLEKARFFYEEQEKKTGGEEV